jgi:hypothetical protein
MTNEVPMNSPEKQEALDDNARKFIITPLDNSFFDDKNVTSFDLVVDWLETDEASEKKLAYKIFDDGATQILLISKVTQDDGNRKTVKEPLTDEQYRDMLAESVLHLEKNRREFRLVQSGVEYDMKYDVFADAKLCILEVDAKDDNRRAAFNAEDYPDELEEVTGNMDYYGYRICGVL